MSESRKQFRKMFFRKIVICGGMCVSTIHLYTNNKKTLYECRKMARFKVTFLYQMSHDTRTFFFFFK